MIEPNIILSKQMREFFIKDNGIPMQVIEDPYFHYYLNLFDPYFQSLEKYKLLIDTIGILGDESKISEVSRTFMDEVNFHIEESPCYQNFVHDMILPDLALQLKKGNLYQKDNNGKQFASIDLVEANYQSMKFVCPLVLAEETYEEFANRFTVLRYIITCKKIRQIIFGQLSPSKQQGVQRHIISVIQKYLMDNVGIKKDSITATSSDEIVFETKSSSEELKKLINEYKECNRCKIPGIEGIRLRITVFELKQHGTDKYKFFVKHHENGKKEIKGVEAAYMPEVIKFFEGRAISSISDTLFVRNGRICNFRDSLF